LPLGVYVVQQGDNFTAHLAYAKQVGSKLRRVVLENDVPAKLVELAILFLKEDP
jgi:hypothetical protein